MKIAIIIPVCNSMPYLEETVNRIIMSTKAYQKIIFIESESNDGTAEYVDELEKIYRKVQVLHTKKEGLTRAINKGIQLAKGMDVYITQDDVVHFRLYKKDWLEELHKASKIKKTGIVTTINGGGISGPDYIDGLNWVGTWSLYIPRKTIDKVGLFDENLGPGDDIDYTYRVYKAGLIARVCNFWVQHHRLTEHPSVDTVKTKKKMAEKFRKKWGIE